MPTRSLPAGVCSVPGTRPSAAPLGPSHGFDSFDYTGGTAAACRCRPMCALASAGPMGRAREFFL